MKKQPIVLPIYYFENQENRTQHWLALRKLPHSSRDMPDFLTKLMLQAYREGDLSCFFIPHWYQIANETDDGRTIRNMLAADGTGTKPKFKSRNYDLVRYIDICLQVHSAEYAEYVKIWCKRQIMCLDDDDEDLF